MEQLTIETHLVRIAHEKSYAFCYGCYCKAKKYPNGVVMCSKCESDDLMRITDNDGPEYGVGWIIDEILENNCEQLSQDDLSERFEEMLDECYPPVKVFSWELSPSVAFKRLDPTAFDLGLSEYIDTEVDETLLTFDGGTTYYTKDSIEEFISLN